MKSTKSRRRQTKLCASVVTPFAGGDSIEHLLYGLANQTLQTDRWELIIAAEQDLGPHSRQLIDELEAQVVVIPSERTFAPERHSAGHLRNRGVLAARAPLIIFLDSDCMPSPVCLEYHVAAHARDRQGALAVCGGMCELEASGLSVPMDAQGYSDLQKLCAPDFRGERSRATDWQDFYSVNVSLSRGRFQNVGGFDEAGFRCHDMELGYRLKKSGCRFLLLPACSVIHVEHPRTIQARLEQAKGWAHLGSNAPEIRPQCQRQSRSLIRSHDVIAAACEKRFAALVRGMPGHREGKVWTLRRPGIGRMWKRMRQIPFCVRQSDRGVQLNLRLHRSCWDYSVVFPKADLKHWRKTPRISVVIATYNHARFLDHAIASVLTQTVQNVELLIVDDASTDDTCHVLSSHANDSRIRIFTNPENLGLSQCLNKALEVARSSFLLQLDADDFLMPTALEQVLGRFRDPSIGAVFGCTRRRPGRMTPERILGSLEQTAPRAYRVSAARGIGGWTTNDAQRGRYFEDRLMLARIAEKYRTTTVQSTLYRVREVNNSLSRRGDRVAAVAKMSIITDFANERGRNVAFVSAGGSVKPVFAGRRSAEPTLEWSIVIPCYNNRSLLQYCLRSIYQSDLFRAGAEVIVVDDGSTLPLNGEQSVRTIQLNERGGAAVARNVGAKAALGEMLLFCDADHIVPPDVGNLHEQAHLTGGPRGVAVGVVRGRRVLTSCAPSDMPAWLRRVAMDMERFGARSDDGVFADLVWDRRFEVGEPTHPELFRYLSKFAFSDGNRQGWADIAVKHGSSLQGYPHAWMALASGCFSIPKPLFEEHGGFSTEFRSMEDWEFGARMHERGVPIRLLPSAEPLHQWHARDPERAQNNVRASRMLARRHPALVRSLLGDDGAGGLPGRELLETPPSRRSSRVATMPNRSIVKGARSIYLTFDDGPHEIGTRLVLDVLGRFQAKATFFFLGERVKSLPDVCRLVAAHGHEVGVHSWDHSDLERAPAARIYRALADSVEVIGGVTGKRVRFSRPPYGRISRNYVEVSKKLGLKPILWDVSSGDWGCSSVFEVMRNLASSSLIARVVLFHDGCGDPTVTTDALDRLLTIGRDARLAIRNLNPRTLNG